MALKRVRGGSDQLLIAKKKKSLKEWLDIGITARGGSEVTISGSVGEVSGCVTWEDGSGGIVVMLGCQLD